MMRWLAQTETTASMALYSNLTVVGLLCLGLPFYWITPSGPDLLRFLLGGGLGTVALLLLITAYRRAAAVLIAPFQYTQMIWGLILGLSLWGDRPTLAVSIGALIIAATGIFTFYREHRLARSAPATVALAPANDPR